MTLFDTVKCVLCGPLPDPQVHDTCHKPWCGHKTDDHSAGMRCKVCKQECGIDARRSIR